MKIVLMIVTISCIFSQANYQILSTASNFKDIFEIDDFYDNYPPRSATGDSPIKQN